MSIRPGQSRCHFLLYVPLCVWRGPEKYLQHICVSVTLSLCALRKSTSDKILVAPLYPETPDGQGTTENKFHDLLKVCLALRFLPLNICHWVRVSKSGSSSTVLVRVRVCVRARMCVVCMCHLCMSFCASMR